MILSVGGDHLLCLHVAHPWDLEPPSLHLTLQEVGHVATMKKNKTEGCELTRTKSQNPYRGFHLDPLILIVHFIYKSVNRRQDLTGDINKHNY